MDGAESLIYHHTDKLVLQLEKRQGEVLNICQWLEYYTFDAMGKFGLSVDFDNLSGNEHPIMKIYHIAHRRLGPLAAAPWVKHLLMGIPFIERMKYYRIFFQWTHEELNKNIKVCHSLSEPIECSSWQSPRFPATRKSGFQPNGLL